MNEQRLLDATSLCFYASEPLLIGVRLSGVSSGTSDVQKTQLCPHLFSITQRTPVRRMVAKDDLFQTSTFHHSADLVFSKPLLQRCAEPIQGISTQNVEIFMPVKRERNGINVKA